MGRFLGVLGLVGGALLPACGGVGGSAPEVAARADDAGTEPVVFVTSGAPEDTWLLDLSGAAGRWVAPAPEPRTRTRELLPLPWPADVRIQATEDLPWSSVLRGLGSGRYRGGNPALWFSTTVRDVRVPIRQVERPGVAARVALAVTLGTGADGALALFVRVTGEAWWGAYGCEAPASAEWPWRGAPDGDLADWIRRALEAAGFDPAALSIRVRAGETVAVGDMLDLLGAVTVEARGSGVDLGLPNCSCGEGRALGSDGVERDLVWLAAHQAADGRWSGTDSGPTCAGTARTGLTAGDGRPEADVATTGLALCVFLGAGYTNRGNHPFAKRVSLGLRWLRQVQDERGGFAPDLRDHAWATLAITEAYGMTESPVFLHAATAALERLEAWAYEVPDDPETLLPVVLALASARNVAADATSRGKPEPWRIREDLVASLRARLASVDTRRGGLASAVSLFGRLLLGTPKEDLRDEAAALPLPGTAEADPHPAYAWLGAQIAYRIAGPTWKAWSEALLSTVVSSQRDGDACCYGGSWDVPPGAPLPGGRVEASAIYAMSLQLYYRYDRAIGAR